MENKNDLNIIIPAYLEEENLRILLPRIKVVADDLKVKYEIVIVDTMTEMDNTHKVCDEMQVKYINRENGNKYGDAIRTAIQHSNATHILFMDADGSHSPEFIKNLYSHKEGNDIVIASRFIDGGGSDNKKVLIFMSWTVNFIYSFLFNLKCKDVSNSFKLYNGDLLRSITLKCDNFDIIEEILIKLKRKNKNLKLKEIPYIFKERMFGQTKRNLIAFVFSYIFTLIKLKFSR
ncbi:MAG: glycosyltransferase [Bacteroidota bacterium]